MINLVQKQDEGRSFEIGGARVLIKVSGRDTNGAYSLMHWTMAPKSGSRSFGHVHGRYEETFYVLNGNLNFILGHEIVPMSTGDFVRVPVGVRHGLENTTDQTVEMLVGFTPAGMEELFYKYRTDVSPLTLAEYVQEAKLLHATEYEPRS